MEQKNLNNKSSRQWLLIAALCCLLLIVIAFVGTAKVKEFRNSEAAEEQVWLDCIKKDTYIEYGKYIVSYPEGKHSREALQRMDELKKEEEQTMNE